MGLHKLLIICFFLLLFPFCFFIFSVLIVLVSSLELGRGIKPYLAFVFNWFLKLYLMLSLGARRKYQKCRSPGIEFLLVFIGSSAHWGSILLDLLKAAKCIRA